MLGFISVTPFLSGVFDPTSLTSNFGLIFPGIGPILMIVCSILLFLVGRRERKTKISLGLVRKNYLRSFFFKTYFRVFKKVFISKKVT
jgi:hypothetical protein